MKNKKEEKKVSRFWLIFRVPESITAFLSGAFISAAINILTNIQEANLLIIIAAVLMIAVSLLLVIWSICVKQIDDIFKSSKKIIDKESENDSNYPMKFWVGLFENPKNKKIRNMLIFVFILLIILIISVVVLLILSKYF